MMNISFGTDGVNQQFGAVYTTHTTVFTVNGQHYAWIIDPAGGFDVVFMAIPSLHIDAWKDTGMIGASEFSGVRTATPFQLIEAIAYITRHYAAQNDVQQFSFSGSDVRLAAFYNRAMPRIEALFPEYVHEKRNHGHVFTKRSTAA